jgi:hypothetical protein
VTPGRAFIDLRVETTVIPIPMRPLQSLCENVVSGAVAALGACPALAGSAEVIDY